jgi:hypothetical protein
VDCRRWRASGVPDVVLLRYCASMPAPTNERQSFERELREELLPAQLAAYQQELAGGVAAAPRSLARAPLPKYVSILISAEPRTLCRCLPYPWRVRIVADMV